MPYHVLTKDKLNLCMNSCNEKSRQVCGNLLLKMHLSQVLFFSSLLFVLCATFYLIMKMSFMCDFLFNNEILKIGLCNTLTLNHYCLPGLALRRLSAPVSRGSLSSTSW